jgi:hypothetical protein
MSELAPFLKKKEGKIVQEMVERMRLAQMRARTRTLVDRADSASLAWKIMTTVLVVTKTLPTKSRKKTASVAEVEVAKKKRKNENSLLIFCI